MLGTFLKLRRKGVIGVNERNIRYVSAANPRRLLHRVDDKIETKRLAVAADIPTPELYGVIRNARDLKSLPEMMARPGGCVIKPAQGSQGKGILVIDGPLKGGWRLASGRRITADAVRFHVNNILSGMYSLGGQPDAAIVEYRVEFDTAFEAMCFKGVPDIRVIVLGGLPVFAMMRLPTAASDGKANLHRGGVGVGLSISEGVTEGAMQYDRRIDAHPDTAAPLSGVAVPHWDEILLMAARSYDVAGLGYMGVDVVLDRARGPLLLELNARPGLSIQIANSQGLKPRLEAAARLEAADRPAAARARLAKRIYEKTSLAARGGGAVRVPEFTEEELAGAGAERADSVVKAGAAFARAS